ncbi:hypothetical protein NUBL22009_42600 [Klebsiella pneumoniae]|nr:hypothetical protein NUBL22009_42600 [Klebsiella pneumoniae]
MTKPETDGSTYFYVHYVECSGCGVGTKRFSEQIMNIDDAVNKALSQWEKMNNPTALT